MGGCSPVQNPAGAVACGTKLVLAVDASVRACPNNVTIRQAVKDFFATVEGTTTEVSLMTFAGACADASCLLQSTIVIPYSVVNSGVINTVNTFMDTIYSPCVGNRLQNWAIPFDTLTTQYTEQPSNLIILTPALFGPNSPGCSAGATSCAAAATAACTASSIPKISGVHVFPISVDSVAANGLNALQQISGINQWDNKLASLSTSDYALPTLSSLSSTLSSVGAALCCRSTPVSVDARMYRQCVVPSNGNAASVQTFVSNFSPTTSSIWLTSFQITLKNDFAKDVVCPGWTVTPVSTNVASVSGGSVYIARGSTVSVVCTWTPSSAAVDTGYTFTVSNAVSSSCSVTSGQSSTPSFNVQNSCVIGSCTAPNPDLQPRCGLRVLLILDESSSICQTQSVDQVRQAFLVFVNSLNTGPLSNITNFLGITEFSLAGSIITPTYLAVNDQNIQNVFLPYITQGYDPCGASSLTAWGAGLDAAYSFSQANTPADLTVMITDGEPNVPADAALPVACQAANRIKLSPSHMFVVGVGTAFSNQVALQTITGPEAWNGQPSTFPSADYQVLPSFDQLGAALRDIVVAFCCPQPVAVISPGVVAVSPCSQGLPFVTLSATSAPSSSVGSVSIVLTETGTLFNRNSLLNCTPPLSGNLIAFPSSIGLGASPQNLAVCTINVDATTPLTVTFTDFTGVPPVCRPQIGSPSAFPITVGPPTLSITAGTITNARCGQNNGAIQINVAGGTAPFTFLWSNGATTQNIQNLAAGTYSVTVTDSTGCSGSLNGIVVAQAGSPVVSLVNTVPAACFGQSTGSVFISVSGGQGPYTFSWTGGSTSQNLTNVPAGSYSVTVTDSNSCSSTGGPFVVTQPSSGLVVVRASQTNVSCFGQSTGSIQIAPSGGTPPYTFLWSSGATTQNLSNIPAGSYSVNIRDSSQCQLTSTPPFVVSQPLAALTITQQSITPVACFGGSTGAVTVNVAGGTTPYSFLWSNGATTQNLNGVVAGSYTLTVTDGNGCTSTSPTFVVAQPAAALNVSSVVVTNAGCFGSVGNVTITVTGGTAPYTFLWSNGATTQNLIGVAPGTYSVTVTDARSCSTVRSNIVVGQPSGSLLVTLANLQNVNCFGGATGAINIGVSGGTPPYSFVWTSGQTTQNISGLTAGVFNVTVQDSNGCTSGVNSFRVTQPAAPLLATASAVNNVLCFGGSTGGITVVVSGGTSPYSFLWSNGQTSQNLVNVPAGSYNLTVTDANGCVSGLINQVVGQPTLALNAVSTSTPTSCTPGSATGTASVTPTGGTLPYSFLWNTGATTSTIRDLPVGVYNNTVTDANGCTFASATAVSQASSVVITGGVTQNVTCFGSSNGAISVSATGGIAPYTFSWQPPQAPNATTLTGLSAGFYTVTVADANVVRCEQMRVFQVTQPAAALSASLAVVTNVSCFGASTGSVTINVGGGTAPYTFLWSNGATTQNLNGIPAGTYSVQVRDANNCGPVTVSATVSQPAAALTVALGSVTNVSCFGAATGSATINVAGGTAPYTFLWSNGATTQNLNGVPAGTYTVQVRDANNCGPATLSVTISQPASGLSVTLGTVTNVACFGGSTGSATINVAGGTAPYTFLWSNGATTQNLNGVPAGTYTVQVRDANNCGPATLSVTISQPASALSVQVTGVTNSSCPGNTGSITTFVSGGTAPYTFSWSNGATSQNLNGVGAGSYVLTVTDSRGCSASTGSVVVGCTSTISLSCPPDFRGLCPANFDPSNTGRPTVSGCAEFQPPTFTDSAPQPLCGNTGITTRTWTVVGCGRQASCVQTLTTFDDVKPQIAPLVPGGLNNVTVACLSEVPKVPVPGVVATDNCQNSNTLLPCNCCNLCRRTELFPCCNCERPRRIEFALTPTSCNTAGNADSECRETTGFSLTAGTYNVQISDAFTGQVYFSGAVAAGASITINNNASFVKLAYRVSTAAGPAGSQTGSVSVSCKTFRRGEVYGSLQVVGMLPGAPCTTVLPCPCCDQCAAVTVVKRVATLPKCLGMRCGPSAVGSKDGTCCAGASCRPGLGGHTCQITSRANKRDNVRVEISYATTPLQNGELRVWTANDRCGNVQQVAQTVLATSTSCKREEEL